MFWVGNSHELFEGALVDCVEIFMCVFVCKLVRLSDNDFEEKDV